MNNENENPSEYEVIDNMDQATSAMDSDRIRYDLSIRIKAQLATNDHRMQNGEEALNYRAFPETHPGYLSKIRQQVLAKILKKSILTDCTYDINRNGYVIWEKGKTTYPKATALMFVAVFQEELTQQHP
jgi:hypothetical protein